MEMRAARKNPFWRQAPNVCVVFRGSRPAHESGGNRTQSRRCATTNVIEPRAASGLRLLQHRFKLADCEES